VLSIRHANAHRGNGRLQMDFRVDARTPVPLLELRGQADEIDLGPIVSQIEHRPESAGVLDATLDLRSRGSTAAELRNHLEGEIHARVREATLASRKARSLVLNLMRVSIPSFRMPERAPAVSCLVAEFEIENGIAKTERFFFDAPSAVVTATGRADLARGVLRLRVTPEHRDPGLLSVAVSVDVTGPITAPVFTPVPRTVASSLVEGLVPNAMEPARSILFPFRRRAPKEKEHCSLDGAVE
jgi:uncharacterized protein involved in outer membrane biogenesis